MVKEWVLRIYAVALTNKYFLQLLQLSAIGMSHMYFRMLILLNRRKGNKLLASSLRHWVLAVKQYFN